MALSASCARCVSEGDITGCGAFIVSIFNELIYSLHFSDVYFCSI